ncbi:unnamed protein product [Closterium sp. NIES-53]
MVTLTLLKYRYDKRAKRKKAAGAGAEDGGGVTATAAHVDAADGDAAVGSTDGSKKGCPGSSSVDEALEGVVDGRGAAVIAADTDGVLEHRRHSGSKEASDIVTTNELEMRRL